ncbi:MAG TPA: membrane protein insertase YidC [Candidatus Angelobacter sp.]
MTQYYDPKNEPGGEKKLLMAFLLVFVGIAVMQYLIPKPASQPKPEPPAEQPAPPPASAPTPKKPPAPTPTQSHKQGPSNSKKKPSTASPATTPDIRGDSETKTIIDSSLYRIAFTNHGGMVTSWVLKKYKNDRGKPCNEQNLDGCLDLVNPVTVAALGSPLSLLTYDQGLEKKLNDAMFAADSVGIKSAPASITFRYTDSEYPGGSLAVSKTFTFTPGSYAIGIETAVTENGNPVQAFPQWPGGFGDQIASTYYGHNEIVWEQEGKVTRKPPQSGWFLTGKSWVVGGQTINGPFEWVGLVDAYFAAVFMPESPKDTNLVTLHSLVDVPRNIEKPAEGAKDKVAVLGIGVGEANGITKEHLFVGPKEVEVLESIQPQPSGPDLRGLIDFGWFGFISRPLFVWLKWTYHHMIPNWGWAIAFLTIVINGVLLPLRLSGMKSQLKMQKVQPQLKAIQEKYKRYGLTDPRRAQMQQEMSALYKKEGVNPVGGCFPMLLQLPFLYAFYSVLGNAIDLRQANWLWIRDLSGADPLHILPIGIMITMYFSQKTMPQGGMEPTQQKMMQVVMPLMLGLISWGLPAGLGIYWAISNLMAWVQQIAINRTEFGKQVRKTLEKRAVRKR